MTKASDEIKRIMASLPDHMVKKPEKKQVNNTKMQQLEQMKKECSDRWEKFYGRYLDGDKDLTEILPLMTRMIQIDEAWLNEGHRLKEESLLKRF